jgi:hypothetical protein
LSSDSPNPLARMREIMKVAEVVRRRITCNFHVLFSVAHNYIRAHAALGGKTPSEVADIKIKGKDKWLTIIQHATVTKTKPCSV